MKFLRLLSLVLVMTEVEKCILDYVGETGTCKEVIVHNRKSLNCSHQNLSFIPQTDNDIKTLIFSYNNLSNVTSETFGNISSPTTMIELDLDHNNIHRITANALVAFLNLEFLDLSDNPIFYDDLKHLLGSLSNTEHLHQLSLIGMKTLTIQKDLFSLMKGNSIETLDVTFNSMKIVDIDTFRAFNSLKTLFLKNNNIEEVILSTNKLISHLYIDYNNIKTFPNFSVSANESECYLPNLELFSIRKNYIAELYESNLNCLLKLKNLQLGENPFHVLNNNLISNLPNLNTLQLRYSPSGKVRVKAFAFNSTSLETLKLIFNSPAGDVFESFEHTFMFSPNLRNLKLSFISMFKLSSQQFSKLFSPLENLSSFSCFACEISQDPQMILKHMKSVSDIDLQSNRIASLSDNTLKENMHLRHLNLRGNAIEHIFESVFPVSMLNRLISLDLSKNPFVCDCELEWFINWLQTNANKSVIERYPQNYICSLPPEKSKMQLSQVHFTYKECHQWSVWIWVAIIASPCVVVISIIVFVAYRNRWNIKHYIYLLRKRRNYNVIDNHTFVYDAFVGYESKDSTWVRRRLLPVLEDEQGLKLCIHERDFPPGAFINDNIVTNMDMSAKVILILTNTFARSEWCMFELKVAHSKMIEDGTELVAILLEKIDGNNMNRSLKNLFETATYIEWTEDNVGQELFWTKLKDVLRNK